MIVTLMFLGSQLCAVGAAAAAKKKQPIMATMWAWSTAQLFVGAILWWVRGGGLQP